VVFCNNNPDKPPGTQRCALPALGGNVSAQSSNTPIVCAGQSLSRRSCLVEPGPASEVHLQRAPQLTWRLQPLSSALVPATGTWLQRSRVDFEPARKLLCYRRRRCIMTWFPAPKSASLNCACSAGTLALRTPDLVPSRSRRWVTESHLASSTSEIGNLSCACGRGRLPLRTDLVRNGTGAVMCHGRRRSDQIRRPPALRSAS
jgi:hypothetical protein